MTPRQMMEMLQGVRSSMKMTISPGPFTLMVDEYDAVAAELIEWLDDRMGEGLKIDEMLNVMDAARWWIITFSTWYSAETIKPVPEKDAGSD